MVCTESERQVIGVLPNYLARVAKVRKGRTCAITLAKNFRQRHFPEAAGPLLAAPRAVSALLRRPSIFKLRRKYKRFQSRAGRVGGHDGTNGFFSDALSGAHDGGDDVRQFVAARRSNDLANKREQPS